jgi:hypothetical protein
MESPNNIFKLSAVMYTDEEDIEKTFEFDALDYCQFESISSIEVAIASQIDPGFVFGRCALELMATNIWYFNN